VTWKVSGTTRVRIRRTDRPGMSARGYIRPDPRNCLEPASIERLPPGIRRWAPFGEQYATCLASCRRLTRPSPLGEVLGLATGSAGGINGPNRRVALEKRSQDGLVEVNERVVRRVVHISDEGTSVRRRNLLAELLPLELGSSSQWSRMRRMSAMRASENAFRPRSVTRPLSKAKPAQPRRRSPTRLLALTPQDSLAGTDCGVSALNRSQKLDTRIRNSCTQSATNTSAVHDLLEHQAVERPGS
jgi:hypothetical protein